MNSRIAVFPGSFDPITIDHHDLIDRAAGLFDKLIIAIGVNGQKQSFFPLEKRLQWLQDLYGHRNNISVEAYEGLTVDFCARHQAGWIVRGVRNAMDFEYEKTIAALNRSLENGPETIFLPASPQFSHISSTIVRELVRHGGPYAHLVPLVVTKSTQ